MTEYTARDWAQVEARWRPFADKHAALLEARGKALAEAKGPELAASGQARGERRRQARNAWHQSRADSMRRTLQDRLADCETKLAAIRTCTHRCRPSFRKMGCGQWKTCQICQKKRQRRMFARTSEAMRAHSADWRNRRLRSTWYMLTLTVQHSGDVQRDADVMRRSWRKFWRWFTDHHRDLYPEGWLPPHITAHEMTDGDDGLGHYHLHACFLHPRNGKAKVDYTACHAAWRRITTELGQPSCVLKFTTGQTKKGKQTESHTPEAAAAYLAKHSVPTYAVKSETGATLADDRLADWLAATYSRRVVHTSRKFWIRYTQLCPCCRSRVHLLIGPAAAMTATWEAWSTEGCGEESG